MRFDIDPKPDEFRRANTAMVRAIMPPEQAANFGVIGLYLAVILAGTFLVTATAGRTIVIGLAAISGALSIQQWDVNRRIKKSLALDPHVDERYSIEITDAGVRNWCAHIDARYGWSDFSRILLTPEFLLFVRPSGAGATLPLRVTDSATTTALLEQIAGWAPHIEVTRTKK